MIEYDLVIRYDLRWKWIRGWSTHQNVYHCFFLSIFLVHVLMCLPIEYLGVILEYELRDKSREMKEIDLLHLTPEYVSCRVIPL